MTTLKARELTNIAADLRHALDLAHICADTRADIVLAELHGAATMTKDARAAVVKAMLDNDYARAAMWVAEAEYQYQRGCALKAEWKRLQSEQE